VGGRPPGRWMARTISKTLVLTREVIDELEDEENQSRTVDKLLRDHYGLAPREEY
jgi:hypothetical protein